jgi:hypothetical protein
MRDRLSKYGILNKAVFVVNGAYRENDKDAKKYKELLSETVSVAESVLTQRKAYGRSDADQKVSAEISKFLIEKIL